MTKLGLAFYSSCLVFAASARQAVAYTAAELDVKAKAETRLHEQATRYLQRLLAPEQFRLAESVEVYTSRPQTKSMTNEAPKSPPSWLEGAPQDLTVGIIEAQEYAATAQAARNAAAQRVNKPLEASIEIGDIQLFLGLREDVPENQAQSIKQSLAQFVSMSLQSNPKVELTRFNKIENKGPEPQPKKSLLDLLKDFAVPLAALILGLTLLLHVLLQKRLPSWKDIAEHKIALKNESPSTEKKKEGPAENESPLALQHQNRPAPIDDLGEFKRYRELMMRLLEKLRKVDDTLSNGLLEAWYLEGEKGLRKSVFMARAWNEVRPDQPLRLNASQAVVGIFRSVSQISYAERNVLLEDILSELSGAEAIGVQAFGHRFGFILAKPVEVLFQAVNELDDTGQRARLLAALPAEKRREVLTRLESESKSELVFSAMGLTAIPMVELDALAEWLRASLSRFEQNAGLNGDTLDVSEIKLAFLEALSSQEELPLVAKLCASNPDAREWLKTRYFGLSLLPDLSDAALSELLSKLGNEEIANVLLAFEPAFTDKKLRLLGELQAAIIKDTVNTARAANKEPDWKSLDRWVQAVRRNLQKKKSPPAALFASVDQARAADFERKGLDAKVDILTEGHSSGGSQNAA